MSSDLIDKLIARYKEPDPHPYLFKIGQTIRVRVKVIEDGQTPLYWAGAKAKVISRLCTGLHKEHWYKVYLESHNVTCDFSEEELDLRYAS
jgi:hypothetical protein